MQSLAVHPHLLPLDLLGGEGSLLVHVERLRPQRAVPPLGRGGRRRLAAGLLGRARLLGRAGLLGRARPLAIAPERGLQQESNSQAPSRNREGSSVEVKLGVGVLFSTWMVWPKRRTAPFFTGEMRLASDVTLPRGRTRLVLGSWRDDKEGKEKKKGGISWIASSQDTRLKDFITARFMPAKCWCGRTRRDCALRGTRVNFSWRSMKHLSKESVKRL